MFKNISYIFLMVLAALVFSCDASSSESSKAKEEDSKTKISGSFTLNGGKSLVIEAGKSKDIALDISGVKPEESGKSTFTFTSKEGETLPTGVTVTYQEATKKIRIATTAKSIKAEATYTIVATLDKDDKKYEGSVEGTIKLTIIAPLAITIDADALTGNTLKKEYGRTKNGIEGKGNFPPLSWTGIYTAVDFLVLVYQGETSGEKNYGHGIWIVAKTTTSLPKKIGTLGVSGGAFTGNHALLDVGAGNNKVLETIETYYAARSYVSHSYKFYLFGIDNLTQTEIKTELDKVKRTEAYNSNKGTGGKSKFTDRAAKIKELLGANIIQEATSKTVGYDPGN